MVTYNVFADAERVLKIIESLVEHVPEDIRLELDSLVGLLKSPLFYQYLDHHDLQKISQLSNKVTAYAQRLHNPNLFVAKRVKILL